MSSVMDDIDLNDHELRVGDRVLVDVNQYVDNRFGRITRLLTYTVEVRMEGGHKRLVDRRKLYYAPTDQEIAALCRAIQRRWDRNERRARLGLIYLHPYMDCEPVEIQLVGELGRLE